MAGIPWSEEEDEIVNSTMPLPDIAEATGRTIKAIRHRRAKLKSGGTRRFRRWTPSEDALILTPGASAESLASAIGCTIVQVRSRRSYLQRGVVKPLAQCRARGCDQPIDPSANRNRKYCSRACVDYARYWRDPDKRRLQANNLRAKNPTRIREAKARYWNLNRERILVARRGEPVARDLRKRAQAATATAATRHRARWSAAEDLIVLRDDISAIEMAFMLNRTLSAVGQRRHKLAAAT